MIDRRALIPLFLLAACVDSELPSTPDGTEPPVRNVQDRPVDPTAPDATPAPEEDMSTDMPTDMPNQGDMPTDTSMEDTSPTCPTPAECTMGTQRCSGTLVQVCIEGPNGCPIFDTAAPCPGAGESCVDDVCIPAGSCEDLDKDGYGVGCTNGADCDDNNPLRNFGRVEECDNIDNDCDGVVDNGIAGVGDACTTGSGTCEAMGTQVCGANGAIVCDATPPTGSPEVCDGMDNDCDGVIDNGSVCPTPMCGQDNQETNESISAAFALPTNTSAVGLTCQNDKEFFALDTTAGVPHRVNVAFANVLSDLNVTVYEDGVPLGSASSTTDHEIAQFTPAAGKTYVAEVTNPSGDETFYQISSTNTWGCTNEDAFAPNHSINTAKFLPRSWLTDAYMCTGSQDWYYLGTIPSGTLINIRALFSAGLLGADLELYLYADHDNDNTFDRIKSAKSWGSDEFLQHTTTYESRYYLLVEADSFGGSNDYRIGWTDQ